VGSVARSGASKLRYAMSCIDMPEVAYLYGYLLVSARVYTSDCTPTSCRSDARDKKHSSWNFVPCLVGFALTLCRIVPCH